MPALLGPIVVSVIIRSGGNLQNLITTRRNLNWKVNIPPWIVRVATKTISIQELHKSVPAAIIWWMLIKGNWERIVPHATRSMGGSLPNLITTWHHLSWMGSIHRFHVRIVIPMANTKEPRLTVFRAMHWLTGTKVPLVKIAPHATRHRAGSRLHSIIRCPYLN